VPAHAFAPACDRRRGLSERGIIIALCSGRSNAAIEAHAARLALQRPLPVVSFNGACGLLAEEPGWTRTAQQLFTTPVPMAVVARVLDLCAAAGLLVQYCA
jgi:hydroxymethylpyrimidine pyrophosphatase-like HAD family hydrolase